MYEMYIKGGGGLHMETVLDLSEEMEVDLSKNMELSDEFDSGYEVHEEISNKVKKFECSICSKYITSLSPLL